VRSRERALARRVVVFLVVATILGLMTSSLPAARATPYPTVPLALDRWFVSNLTGAELAPGGGGAISFTVGDPLAGVALSSTVLTLQVYAFNAFPGNATSPLTVAAPPVLVSSSGSGAVANVSLGTVAAGSVVAGSVEVQSSGTTPSGTFAVRTALRFVAGGADYLLESRGWFTDAQWSAATAGPGGSVDLNVSALGVSGVIPETSILVSSSNLSTAIYAVLGAGLVLVGLAAWLYFRPPKSSSGVRKVPADIHAPSAFGTSRTKDGD
jgi:hypothetical protein